MNGKACNRSFFVPERGERCGKVSKKVLDRIRQNIYNMNRVEFYCVHTGFEILVYIIEAIYPAISY